ncbi:MAG: [FeFe] hydrogenase H-cluster maturation GTPase HydF [Firmicutes bacterium]|nr:[FeFe] hydrogenase H-cluster maturation GTPase HydF [Bacillota bacterium]
MQETPRSDRMHIAIFGRRNAGKSSLINALTNQPIALVSDIPGTTTDPVYKSMEMLPLGPVVLIDTAGIDDVGSLGELRVQRTMEVLHKTDLAILLIDPQVGIDDFELELVQQIRAQGIPLIGAVNKVDTVQSLEAQPDWETRLNLKLHRISTQTKEGINELRELIIHTAPTDWQAPTILGDLIQPGDTVVMVVPIDLEAPKGRLILPQVQTLRDILDHNAQAVVVKEDGLSAVLDNLRQPPKLVVTDSQAFHQVNAIVPPEISLTSFSILFARYKGDLLSLVKGARQVAALKPGDRILVAEACTHHPIGEDIGRIKIPRWLSQRVSELEFAWATGSHFPADLNRYSLVIHCGACMINRREMLHRIRQVQAAGVPIVNYGVLIAYLHGILERALAPFPEAKRLWAAASSK